MLQVAERQDAETRASPRNLTSPSEGECERGFVSADARSLEIAAFQTSVLNHFGTQPPFLSEP